MTDTVRVLLAAAVLSAATLGAFAWRLSRTEADQPERLIGELRLSQWTALLLAGLGGLSVGLAVAFQSAPGANVDALLGLAFVVVAGFVLHGGLLVVAAGFIAHALVDIAHRPGWLPPDVMPRWYAVGSAIFDIYVAAACYWASRR
jgi:hypothetical protein